MGQICGLGFNGYVLALEALMLQRLDKLRESMENGTAAFISGYPNIFYYSGFTSEDAWLVISHDRQTLITDSRYTIQAKEQSPEFEIADIKKRLGNAVKRFWRKAYNL